MQPRPILFFARWLVLGCLFLAALVVQSPAYSARDSLDRFPVLLTEDAVWMEIDGGTGEILSGVWGQGGIFFVVGAQGTILRFDGAQWSPMMSGTTEDFQGVWGTSPGNVYAVGGGGLVVRFNGSFWAPVNTPTTEFLRGAWGTAPDDVFITGTRGTIIHFDGIRWDNVESNSPNRLYDIWGPANNDIFVAGHLATILHYDGAAWAPMTSGVRPTLWGVWGTSGDDAFIVGGEGVIVHFDGSAWEAQDSGTDEDLLRIWGRGPDDAFAVGSGGTILRWDGESWTTMATPTTRTLKGVFGDDMGNVFSVGDAGTILRLDASVPVFVEYFAAANYGKEVNLEWRVTSTASVEGFTIDRIESGTNDHDIFYYAADSESARDTTAEPGKTYRYALTTSLIDGSKVRSQWVQISIPRFSTELTTVFPNPFNPVTTIRYRVGSPSPVSVSIYDVGGVLVRRLVDDRSHEAGVFAVTWDGTDRKGTRSGSGVYFCTLESNNRFETRRIVLLK